MDQNNVISEPRAKVQYKVISIHGKFEESMISVIGHLENIVQNYCKKGWIPQGGISLYEDAQFKAWVVAQAIIKNE